MLKHQRTRFVADGSTVNTILVGLVSGKVVDYHSTIFKSVKFELVLSQKLVSVIYPHQSNRFCPSRGRLIIVKKQDDTTDIQNSVFRGFWGNLASSQIRLWK